MAEKRNRRESTAASCVSGLPQLNKVYDLVEETLEEEGHMGLVLVSVVEHQPLEEQHGWEKWGDFLNQLCKTLVGIKEDILRQDDILCCLNDSEFAIFFSRSRKQEGITRHDLELIRQRLYRSLKHSLPPILGTPYGTDFSCYIGAAILRSNSRVKPRTAISEALEDALIDLSLEETKEAARRSRRLIELIRRQAINVVFKPILWLGNREVLGYRVVGRSSMADFEEPEKLLRVADEARLLWQLERLCRRKILDNSVWVQEDQSLFLKVGAEAIYHDPDLKRPLKIMELCGCHLEPKQLIFEFPATALDNNFALLKQAVSRLRKANFGIALGSIDPSQSSLQLVTQLEPDFVKLAPSLGKNLQGDKPKQARVAAAVDFAQGLKIKLLAENVEKEQDLKTLKKLGVDAASGPAWGLDNIELDYTEQP